MYYLALQTKSKFFKIQPSPADEYQRKSKKKVWICLDSLVRIEPFQGVAATPWAKILSLLLSTPLAFVALGALRSANKPRYHDF
jgi:hypothetical protein